MHEQSRHPRPTDEAPSLNQADVEALMVIAEGLDIDGDLEAQFNSLEQRYKEFQIAHQVHITEQEQYLCQLEIALTQILAKTSSKEREEALHPTLW